MKILLINNNPVVSRLTALSARKEDIEIDEIQEVTELSSDKYDIVFVDADSWSKDVDDIISDNIKVQKRVLFYAQDDSNDQPSFDMKILKPFLPSEVSAVIRSLEESKVETETEIEESLSVEKEKSFNILDKSNDETREELFSLDTDKEVVHTTDIEEELAKIDDVKLVDSFDKQLEESFPLKNKELDDELFEKVDVKADTESEDLFELDLNDDKLSLENELFTEEKTSKSIDSTTELLDFDFEKTDEVDFEKIDEVKEVMLNISDDDVMKEQVENSMEETKILDKSEIANIKDILENKHEEGMELDDLMTPSVPVLLSTDNIDTKEKKKKSKKSKNSSTLHSDVLVETLTSLPIESLRELLSGAKVNISIKFPKVK